MSLALLFHPCRDEAGPEADRFSTAELCARAAAVVADAQETAEQTRRIIDQLLPTLRRCRAAHLPALKT
jgi:hypothetical protein